MINEVPKIRLKDDFQVVVFICYLLDNLGTLTENQIIEIATFDEITGVFEISHALGVLEEKNLASAEMYRNEKRYLLNREGKILADEFNSRIPLSIKEKSIEEGKRILHLAALNRSLNWSIRKKDDGYEFVVRFFNEMTNSLLMEIKIYSPTYENAEEMKKRFLEKPSEIIEKTFNSFISDNNSVFLL